MVRAARDGVESSRPAFAAGQNHSAKLSCSDVVVFDGDNPIEQILMRPPIAVFEVLSPEDRISRMMKKLAEYEAMGIPTVVLIDPSDGAISQFRNGSLTRIEGPLQELSGSRCFIDWKKVEELLD